ncbi:Uu.00g014050.m01.CDS01 [Anthostomella pinea]|uniref:Uu.00g014050.m01.CDS01 n=1 Tax=Anthostomella pinea TaxID=933095 RepID=A0AAI8VSH1_9PEZI|nr:Uu.00g014050.m01.CDS01 [Anthostomella pinea]
MGQGPSHDVAELETRVEDPQDGRRPEGLALIAHGRLGGSFDQAPVRLLAEYFRNQRHLRVVTWNARGNGHSAGGNEWANFGNWQGDAYVDDYQRMLRDAMSRYAQDFPDAEHAQLFICSSDLMTGYSAGAIFAGCARPPRSSTQFAAPRYILISYPVELNPIMAVFKTGSYFRSVEALVQGYMVGKTWPPSSIVKSRPEVAGVLTISAEYDTKLFYSVWTGTLWSKNARGNLWHVVVEGAGHAWNEKAHCIVEEVDKWLTG